ncbi:hypothetical protein C8N35_102160 [Breoghania corrubedonensis]|uniref:DUF6455 domain-containing protein n=1 Tax=Breoghania corrubedonensis TaxID=665038 RepID=A0A2T5VCG5_9HYPH|nr:DUF6455 family protein [Breoghania corrubedonensis]PTW61450.1 hypothetical protein C8N35_102160 [Breoghania corrubedonensis]
MGILKHAGDHMQMMGEMMRQTDIDVSKAGGPSGDAFLRGSIVRCLFCKHGDECRSWLAEGHEHSEPPAFCRNAGRFESFREAL